MQPPKVIDAGCLSVQMLQGLYEAGHCLGVVLPERILVLPELLCLEFATVLLFMQRSACSPDMSPHCD